MMITLKVYVLLRSNSAINNSTVQDLSSSSDERYLKKKYGVLIFNKTVANKTWLTLTNHVLFMFILCLVLFM